MIDAEPALAFETVGSNPTRLWGLSMTERNARIARKAGLGGTGAPVLLANADVAADPAWLSHVAAQPGLVLTLAGVPALAHARDEHEAALLREAMREGTSPSEPERFDFSAYEDGGIIDLDDTIIIFIIDIITYIISSTDNPSSACTCSIIRFDH